MTTAAINSELDRYGVIKTAFGSIDKFLNLYNQSYNDEYGIYRLVQFPINKVSVINRNNYKFSLIKRINNNLEFDSVDPTVPYSILNYKGEKLYSVADHNGIFGNSNLDQLLLNNQAPLGIYILEYDTFRKTDYRLIIVDNSEDNLRVPNYSVSLNNQTSESNYQVSNSLVFFSSSDFTVVTLAKPINTELTLTRLLADPLLTEYQSINKQLSFATTESLWIAILQNGEAVPYTELLGTGNDRLINRPDNLYHLVINNDYTKSYLRRLTGISEFSSDTVQLRIQI